MTVWAYDGKTLAADSMACWGKEIVPVRLHKIVLVRYGQRRMLMVGAGSRIHMAALFRHYLAMTARAEHVYLNHEPFKPDDHGTSIFVIELGFEGRHDAYVVTSEGLVQDVTGEKVADGSGGCYAIGAMDAGKGAAEACEIAIKRASGCGPPVREVNIRTASELQELAFTEIKDF